MMQSVAGKTIKILMVEDCATDMLLFKHMLCGASVNTQFEITHVLRLVEAFERLKIQSFDIIILDLDLLDITGTASIAALRAEVPDIPVIVYSGLNDAKMKTQALMCGARHYLVKGYESGYALKFMIEETLANT